MTEPLPIAEVTRLYSAGCGYVGSPFYRDLLERLAQDIEAGGATARLLDEHERSRYEDAVPLRLLGGVHRKVLEGAAPELAAHYPSADGAGDADTALPEFLAVLDGHEPELRDVLTRPPQTNEVGRSTALVGGLLEVARTTGLPLRLRELGTSAALNLRMDRYWFESDGRGVGDPASPVRFIDLWDGRPPFDVPLTVVGRRGCDRHPIDAASDDGRLTLLSYVWPDQRERFELMQAALDVARGFPVPVDRAGIPEWLDQQLREPAPGTATVVFHSIVWQYLSSEERATVKASLADAGARARPDAPLAWVRLEPGLDISHAELRVTLWPGGETRKVAESGFHVGPVRWLG